MKASKCCKTLAAAMAAVMVMAAGALAQTWDVGATPGTVTAMLSGGTLWVSGSGAMGSLGENGYDAPWWNSNSNITKVVIGNGITTIAPYAFRELDNLTSVTIPNSVTELGVGVFTFCRNLTILTIGAGVTSIGNYAFYSCNNLKTVTSLATTPPSFWTSTQGFYTFFQVPLESVSLHVPETALNAYKDADVWKKFGSIQTLTALGALTEWDCGTVPGTVTAILSTDGTLTISGSGAMADYVVTGSEAAGWGSTAPWADYRSSIMHVYIDDRVTSVGGAAFIGCSNLVYVRIPNSVTSIKNHAFYECTSLKSIKIPEGVISIGSYTFMGSGLTSVTIPNSVTSLTDNTFRNCVNLTSVTIGTGVTSIVREMFFGCTSLTSVISLAEVPPNINGNAFRGVDVASIALYVPHAALDAYRSADIWKDFGSIQAVGAGGALTEWDCGAVPGTVTATLGADGTLTVSGAGAMADYALTEPSPGLWGSTAPWETYRSSITGVVIGDGVTSVGGNTFINCKNLTSISISNSVTSLEERAFHSCKNLTSATIPNSVSVIGVAAFENTGLTSVTIGRGVTDIRREAFTMCDNLTSVTSLNIVPPILGNGRAAFGYMDVSPITLYVPQAALDAYGSADVWKDFNIQVTTSVASVDRVIPAGNPGEVVVVAPVSIFAGEFIAGPNPVGRSSGGIAFFWQGGSLSGGSLVVYDASGNVVRKLGVKDNAIGNAGKRAVGSWDLKDSKGRPVSEGTYLVKGKIVTSGGKGERVSAVVGVR